MKTRILALICAMLMPVCAALATEPVSSITIDGLVSAVGTVAVDETTPEGGTSGLLVYLDPIETAEHQDILDSIIEHAEDEPVIEYFAPEVIEAISEILPSETDTADLMMDEFFELKTEGYTSDHGDILVAFEFTTPYTEEDTLIGVVGIMADSAEAVRRVFRNAGMEIKGSLDENGVFWFAVKAEVIDGRVFVHLPQGVLELTGEYETLFALFSVREIAEMNLLTYLTDSNL